MPVECYVRDERSRACVRALSKLLTGRDEDVEVTLPPAVELAFAGAIFATDSLQRIVYVNRSAAAISGQSVAEILGRTCREAFRCLNCPPSCPLSRGDSIAGREIVLRGPDGGELPLLKKADVLLDGEGAMVGGLEAMHDLSTLGRGAAGHRATATRVVSTPTGAGRHGMIGASPSMRALFERIDRLARVDATVLVSGESGTGKELVARALHEAGPRAGRPFHAINCAAMPESLLESELFGHERGAFTGAFREKPGRFEICEDGTVFLDEIGCLPYSLQSKLLRVLEDGGFERVGGTRPRKLRARVVAATNANLDALVREGAFRADLLYRLKVCTLWIPPLRERREDVPSLARHFEELLAASCGGGTVGFTPSAMAALQEYPWPGNVRELRNVVHSALLVAPDGEIGCEHLPPELRGRPDRCLEAGRIEEALMKARFNRSDAASLLGVSRTTLWRRMKRAGLR